MNATLNLKRHLRPGYQRPWWTPEDLALLGTFTDEPIAALTGNTTVAVHWQRTRRGIPSACDRRRRENWA
jgi:hypothetical protein